MAELVLAVLKLCAHRQILESDNSLIWPPEELHAFLYLLENHILWLFSYIAPYMGFPTRIIILYKFLSSNALRYIKFNPPSTLFPFFNRFYRKAQGAPIFFHQPLDPEGGFFEKEVAESLECVGEKDSLEDSGLVLEGDELHGFFAGGENRLGGDGPGQEADSAAYMAGQIPGAEPGLGE